MADLNFSSPKPKVTKGQTSYMSQTFDFFNLYLTSI